MNTSQVLIAFLAFGALPVQPSLGVLLPHNYGRTSHDSRLNLSADGVSHAVANFFSRAACVWFWTGKGKNNESSNPEL